mgnify:CR=1 FL=1
MRELRFRAWDKKHKQWFDDFHIRASGQWAVYDSEDGGKSGLWEHDISDDYDLEIMQFTGLKDKNGKEIYQFDLWKLGDEIYLIVWKEGDWQTGWKKLAGDNYTDIGKDNAKSGLIIGNLLENPDLLNVPSCSENDKDE